MQHFAIIDQKGKTIATASSMEVVHRYFEDAANHAAYKARKRVLDLERRTYKNAHKPRDPGTAINAHSKDLNELREFMQKKPSLRKTLEEEFNRLTVLVENDKRERLRLRQEYDEAVSNLDAKWYNTLNDEDKRIWDGSWDHAEHNFVPSYKPMQFLG